MLHPSKKYYTQSADQEDLISIGTIGLIKGISSFDPAKGARLATYAARCIENEILMYFRGQKKLQGEVSLSDSIDTDKDGNALQLMDIVGVDDTMLEDLHDRDNALRLHKLVRERLMQPEDAEDAPQPEENCRLHEDRPEDAGDAPRREENGGFHEDAGQPEGFTETQETGTPEDAGFQRTDKGAWYAAMAGNDRQGAPAGKEKKDYGHGILK